MNNHLEFKRIHKYRVPEVVEDRFANSFRGIIRSEPLIDTGDLWKSIQCTVDVDYNVFSKMIGTFNYRINLYAEDYLCYHIIPRQLFTRWRNAKGFQSAQNLLDESFTKYIQDEIGWKLPVSMWLQDIVVKNTPSGGAGFDYFGQG